MDREEAAERLKHQFRKLDTNRDGLLDKNELHALLLKGNPTFTEEEVSILFNQISRNDDKVTFDEFVDYIYDRQQAGQPQKELSFWEKKVEEMKKISDAHMAEVDRVWFRGAFLHEDLNGRFSKADWKFNNLPVYERGYPEAYIFYGWNEDGKKRGWFVASRVPKSGSVKRYKMFNPSSHAAGPHLCTAIWRNPSGKLDKRLFCMAESHEVWEETEEGLCLAEELWDGHVPEQFQVDESMHDALEDEWEHEWQEEAGEGVEDFGAAGYELMYEGGEEPEPDEDIAEVWQDPDFSATAKSVGSAEGWDDWQRVSQMHPQAHLFCRVTSDDAISDALTANFWFLSAMACVAEYPAWIVSAFRLNTTLTANGAYAVRFYHPGKQRFQFVEIDDRIPTLKGGPMSAGVTPEGEVWVALLEKAFAKFCGSYKAMEGGSVAYGLLYLCGGGLAESFERSTGTTRWKHIYTCWHGKDHETIDRKLAEGVEEDGLELDQDSLWAVLREYMEFCYPVAATVIPGALEGSGLMPKLAYSVIGAREVKLKQGLLRLVRLRDPHGFTGWSGRWSDTSDAWEVCPAAKQQVHFKPNVTGTFWMSYADFCKYFGRIDTVRKPMPVQGCKEAKLHGAIRGLRKMGTS